MAAGDEMGALRLYIDRARATRPTFRPRCMIRWPTLRWTGTRAEQNAGARSPCPGRVTLPTRIRGRRNALNRKWLLRPLAPHAHPPITGGRPSGGIFRRLGEAWLTRLGTHPHPQSAAAEDRGRHGRGARRVGGDGPCTPMPSVIAIGTSGPPGARQQGASGR